MAATQESAQLRCARKTITTLAFGGKARSTLFITESSARSILTAVLTAAGKRLPLV